MYREAAGPRRYVKGAPAVVAKLGGAAESVWQPQAEAWRRAASGCSPWPSATKRTVRFAGLLGLEDAVRDDSKAVVAAIRDAGVRTVMVTGDNALTARNVAEQVGIPGERLSARKAARRSRRRRA